MNNSYTNIRWVSLLIALGVGGGALFYALHQEWLVIWYARPYNAYESVSNSTENASQVIAARKKVSLIFWKNERWTQESQELVWPTDKAQALTYLLNSWCALLEEEHISDQKITVQSVLLANGGTQALISFDRIPFAKESATITKWLLLEGLLKTIRENKIALTDVVFLVRHQPLRDYHLDFSNPWPIQGFFEQQ